MGVKKGKGSPRAVFNEYANAVAFVEVQLSNGDTSIGSAFHVGDGVFITARHVVEGHQILSVGTTVSRYVRDDAGLHRFFGSEERYRWIPPGKGAVSAGPFYHSDPSVDVAAFVASGLEPATIHLGDHLDDWMADDDFLLEPVVLLGYPPIPFSAKPTLVAVNAEVNAVVDKYTGGHPMFVVSGTARGGLSGGPCIHVEGRALGVITEALTHDGSPAELGYLAVLTVEPILVCLQENRIVPKAIDTEWEGFWSQTTDNYVIPNEDQTGGEGAASITIYDGPSGRYLELFAYNESVFEQALVASLDAAGDSDRQLVRIHSSMLRIHLDSSAGEAAYSDMRAAADAIFRSTGYVAIGQLQAPNW